MKKRTINILKSIFLFFLGVGTLISLFIISPIYDKSFLSMITDENSRGFFLDGGLFLLTFFTVGGIVTIIMGINKFIKSINK